MAASYARMAALHENAREEISQRIQNGRYAPGAALPSTMALASEFGVSAITIKRALRDLQTAGLIRSVPGLGTFVREQRRFVRDLDISFASQEDIARLGQKTSIELLGIGQRKIDNPVFDIFSAPPGFMLNVQKVIYIDEIATMYDSAFISMPLDSKLAEELSRKFIYEVLNDRGITVTSNRIVIDAAPASSEVQRVFSVPNGYPTLRRAYHFKTIDPDIAVYGLAEAPFDRFACTIELKPKRTKA